MVVHRCKMPPEHLLDEPSLACPTGRRSQCKLGHAGEIVSQLACEHLCLPRSAGDREF